jgi:AraC-like DNA-binding protein
MSGAHARLSLLLESLSRSGTDLSALHAPLAPWELARSAGSRGQASWLEERAFDLAGDRASGLALGSEDSGSTLAVVQQLIESCPNFAAALALVVECSPLLLDGSRLSVRREAKNTLVSFSSDAHSERARRFWNEVAMIRFARVSGLVAIGSHPVEAWFDHPAPTQVEVRGSACEPEAEAYQRALRCPVRFQMSFTGFVFPNSWLERPQSGYDPVLYELLQQETARALARLSAGRISQRVRAVLAGMRLETRAEMASAAAALGMSERALRRRLAAEGASFRELVDDAQRERALVLARDARRSAEHVSKLLGFSEVSAYHRAFKRWTQLTPVQYRQAQLQARQPLASPASAC